MSDSETKVQRTQHAFLVAWGWFGEHIGLPQQIEAVRLLQKRYHHTLSASVVKVPKTGI